MKVYVDFPVWALSPAILAAVGDAIAKMPASGAMDDPLIGVARRPLTSEESLAFTAGVSVIYSDDEGAP